MVFIMLPRLKKFQEVIWGYFHEHKRSFAWRTTSDPYHILVSEIMLQQTQTERVKGYYDAFLKKFPTIETLASASLTELLTLWKGLGYNRRAINLKRAAETIVTEHKGVFPKEYRALLALPGVGPSTAGALMNFAYQIPTAFIETNIRSVYIHFFFKDKEGVDDKELLQLIEKTQDTSNPKEWYYALYDYGVMLKKTIGNQNSRSKHYKKQSAFKGSNRELRAAMLFYLLEHKSVTVTRLTKDLDKDKEMMLKNLEAFEKEGFIVRKGNTVSMIR